MTSGFDLRQHAVRRPQGAVRHLAAAPGLWVHRYWAGLLVPVQSRDGLVTIPAAASANPATTRTSSMIFRVPASPVTVTPTRERNESYGPTRNPR